MSGKHLGSVQRRISTAKFPFIKTFNQFDFSFQPSLNEKELIYISGLNFIDNKENVIFLGPSGVGKTHLAISLGINACQARLRIDFFSVRQLITELAIAQKQGILIDKLLYFSRRHLIIIDEVGYMPISNDEANLFFQFISMCYEKAV